VVLFVISRSFPASAYEGESETVEPPATTANKPDERWYGGPAAIADGLAVLLIGGDGFFLGSTGKSFGIAAGLFTAPISHIAHHHPGRAAASFAMRAAILALTIGAGIVSESNCGDNTSCIGQSKPNYWAIAGLFGGVAFLDDALLPYEKVQQQGGVASLSPRLTRTHEGLVLSFGGAF
jgi:hypothetical protein